MFALKRMGSIPSSVLYLKCAGRYSRLFTVTLRENTPFYKNSQSAYETKCLKTRIGTLPRSCPWACSFPCTKRRENPL
jgi:hypothetical protein